MLRCSMTSKALTLVPLMLLAVAQAAPASEKERRKSSGAERETQSDLTAGATGLAGQVWYVPGPLAVKEQGGEFTSWSHAITIHQAGLRAFRWRPSGAFPGQAAWQLSSTPIPPDKPDPGRVPVIASGPVSVPQPGHWSFFSVDLAAHLPAAAPDPARDYYVRVVALDSAGEPFKTLTSNVALHYKKHEQPHIELKFPTVKEQDPELYASSPMTVEIDVDELYVGNENEGGDEPYLMLAVIYADGTTINPLSLAASTARIASPTKVHGNVPDEDKYGDDLDTTKTAKIPNSTGRFTAAIEPIGLDLVADVEDPDDVIAPAMRRGTRVYLIALGLEEDATSDAAAKAARDTAIAALGKEVNAIVQSMTLADLQAGSPPKFDPEPIQKKIQKKALDAAEDSTLAGPWFLPPVFPTLISQAVDPDDFVGWAIEEFSYGQILGAGNAGIPFEMTLAADVENWEGSYTLRGRIRRK